MHIPSSQSISLPKTVHQLYRDQSPPSEVNITTRVSPRTNKMTRGASAWERMQEDEQMMTKLGIHSIYEDIPFPIHLSHTFEQSQTDEEI
jgi:hypothetical protein